MRMRVRVRVRYLIVAFDFSGPETGVVAVSGPTTVISSCFRVRHRYRFSVRVRVRVTG